MELEYFYQLQSWTIALYEKQGRVYKEISVFFEGELETALAFETIGEFANCYPCRQAVDYALEFEKLNPDLAIPEFEIRLIRNATKKVVTTILWDAETMSACLQDYKNKPRKYYTLTAEIELSGEQLEEDFDNLDWHELIATGCFEPVDMQELAVIELGNQSER